MIYDRRFGLPQSSVDYLNQPLPDISGIFSLPQAAEVIEEDITDTESPVGLTEEQLRLLYPQVGGGDGPRGGGIFGNLDLSDTKDFYVGDEVVTGYKNLSSGLYQDIDGLNIQNLGIRNLPGITGILDSFTTSTPKYPGYFDYYNASDLITNPKSFFNFFRQPTPREMLQQRGLAKQNMAEARALSKKAAADAAARGITGFTGYGTSKQRGAALHGDGDGPGETGPGAATGRDAGMGMGGKQR